MHADLQKIEVNYDDDDNYNVNMIMMVYLCDNEDYLFIMGYIILLLIFLSNLNPYSTIAAIYLFFTLFLSFGLQ